MATRQTRFPLRALYRLLLGGTLALFLGWGLLELMRYRAEHRQIPILVVVDGLPAAPAGRFTGLSSYVTHQVSYSEAMNPRISVNDIVALKRCLARERFLPLFPSEIEIAKEETTASYRLRTNRKTGRSRQTVVVFTHQEDAWRIHRIEERRGIITFARPPTRFEKLLSYLPFFD